MSTTGRNKTEFNDLLSSRRVEHVVVLGANGAMGFDKALFFTAVPKVTFLARTKEKAQQGLQAAVQAVRSSTVAHRVEVGDYESDFDAAVAKADLVFEAVTEDFEIKRQFYGRVDKARRPDSIVASVSSGLSINALAAGRSDSFRKNFLGLHFFNPPNVIVGTEEPLPGKETDPALVDFVDAFAVKKLGRVMIRTFDTPGFAGNRVGFKVLNEVAQLAEEHGPALVETLVGPYTGRAMTPLATIDLVGWDIHRAIVDNVYEKTNDEARATNKLPAYMAAQIEKGVVGTKSGGGFFRSEKGKDTLVLDPKTGSYRPLKEVKLPDLSFIGPIARLHRDGRYREAMQAFAEAPGDWAALARKVVAGYVSYAFHRVGEVTGDPSATASARPSWARSASTGLLRASLVGRWSGPRETVAMIEKPPPSSPFPRRSPTAIGTLGAAKKAPLQQPPRQRAGRFFVGQCGEWPGLGAPAPNLRPRLPFSDSLRDHQCPRTPMSKPSTPPVYLIGGYQTDFARNWTKEKKHFAALMREGVQGALEATAIDPKDVQTAHVGNFAAEFSIASRATSARSSSRSTPRSAACPPGGTRRPAPRAASR